MRQLVQMMLTRDIYIFFSPFAIQFCFAQFNFVLLFGFYFGEWACQLFKFIINKYNRHNNNNNKNRIWYLPPQNNVSRSLTVSMQRQI